MACIDIEYELEKMFISSLRGIFEFDDKFIYNRDEKLTGVVVTTDYPEVDVPGKVPHLIITSIAYDVNMEAAFSRNFFGNVPNGQSYAQVVPYSLTIMCLAELYESKDLANKVVNYVTFQASDVFDDLNLGIAHVSKGVSTPQRQYPEKVFGTPVSITGNLNWVGKKIVLPEYANVLQAIKLNLQDYQK